MRVDYRGLLSQARDGRAEPGLAEMLRQLQDHLQELGERWYDGDMAVVDELLQLYGIESKARAGRPTWLKTAKSNGPTHVQPVGGLPEGRTRLRSLLR